MPDFGNCFACGRPLTKPGAPVSLGTGDDQRPWVGPECAELIKRCGLEGYAPPLGGPRLYATEDCPIAKLED